MMTKSKPRPRGFLLEVFTITLLSAAISGCTQNVFSSQQKGFTKGDDCLFCHATGGISGARDFTPIYENPNSHHPVGVEYPLGSSSKPDFNQPNGYSNGTIFFDNNGNGELNSDEVRLFGAGNAVTVECASCHKEHGNSPSSEKMTNRYYLRSDNDGSRLCLTCHRK